MTETTAALLGVVVGFVMNEAATFFRTRREERQRSQGVRTLIRIELDQNLGGLTNLDQRIQAEEGRDATTPGHLHLPAFLARMSLPAWSHTLWESQLPDVARALRPEALRKTHEFHRDLDNLSEMIVAIRDNPNQVGYRKELYDKCVGLIRSLLERGNPAG